MSQAFFACPILNSRYEHSGPRWKPDRDGLPTDEIVQSRRDAEFISPVLAPRAQRGQMTQPRLHQLRH